MGAPVLWPPIPPYALSRTAVGTAVWQPLCWGPQHLTVSLKQLEVKVCGGRLVLPGRRGGDGSTHRTWRRQGRDAWVSSERDFHVGRQIVQERGQQELGHTHREDEERAREEQQQAGGLFQAGLPQKAGRAEPSPHATVPARPRCTRAAEAVPHELLLGPAVGLGSCPALCLQRRWGVPRGLGGAARAGSEPASVLPHHGCTCVNDPPLNSVLPPRRLSSLLLLLWTLTGDL